MRRFRPARQRPVAFSAIEMPLAPSLHHSLQRQDVLSPTTRRVVVVGVISVQAATAWGLLQIDGVRHAVADVIPVMLQQQLAPPPPPPPPAPPPPPRRVPPPKRELPIIAAPPAPAPAAQPFEVPQVEPEPAPVVVAPEPAVVAAPAPPAPPAPEPRAVDIGMVRYLVQPVLHYPPQSRRVGEQGRVNVRVLVDADGLPREMTVVRSSGFVRLDESALATVRATRFKPHTENGTALAFWVVMPLVFELEN